MSDVRPHILEPKNDHEAIQYIAQTVEDLSKDLKELKDTSSHLATREYVDEKMANVDRRLSDHIAGDMDQDDGIPVIRRFLESGLGRKVSSLLFILVLLGAVTAAHTITKDDMINELKSMGGIESSQQSNNQAKRLPLQDKAKEK